MNKGGEPNRIEFDSRQIKGKGNFMKRFFVWIAAVSILLSGTFVANAKPAKEQSAGDASGMMLHTEGNQLMNEAGVAIRLIGLNVPYTSWSDNCEEQVMAGLEQSLHEWGGNAVRYPVTPALWFGKNKDAYRALADKVIEMVAKEGKYVILDNHSFYLPDQDDIDLWADLAVRYKDHPNVLFELFNEPATCTWQQFYEGGKLSYTGKNDWGEEETVQINSCGMPKLLKTVRDTGAKNVCILPGINWSFDLSFCTEKKFRQFATSVAEDRAKGNTDAFVEEYVEKYFMKETTGNGLMYSTHPYPTKPSDWDTYLLDTVLEYPVLVGECGPTEKESGFIRALTDNDQSYLDTLTAYVDQYGLSITPWAWGAWPYLNQEPSSRLSAFGTYMKKYFEKSIATKAVTLFTDIDYQGDSFTLEAGKYTASYLSDNKFSLENLKSVSCKSDAYQYTITLYSKENFKGDTYTFVPNAANTGKEVSGFAPKSMKIVRSIPQNILQKHAKIIDPGCVENQPAKNIIDGKTGTVWKMVSDKPLEIVLCLDDVYALNRIRMTHASGASMMSVFNASDYTISFSTDGRTFTRVVDVTENALGSCEYKFEQTLASYIKITLTKGSVVDQTAFYLAEVMAYGTPYTGKRDNLDITIDKYVPSGNAAAQDGISVLQIVLLCSFGALTAASITFILIVFFKKKRKKAQA